MFKDFVRDDVEAQAYVFITIQRGIQLEILDVHCNEFCPGREYG